MKIVSQKEQRVRNLINEILGRKTRKISFFKGKPKPKSRREIKGMIHENLHPKD